MKKTVWFLLLLMLAIGCIACSGKGGSKADTTDASSDSISDTTAEEPAEMISFEDLQMYRIIRPERSDDLLVAEISALAREIRMFAPDMILRDDYVQENDPSSTDRIEPYEILIGTTNRPESQEFIASFDRTRDFGYAMINGKIVIAGTTTETTRLAIALFRENVLSAAKDREDCFYSAEDDHSVTDRYALDVFEIGGIPIAEYTVVYPAENTGGEAYCAEWLAKRIDELAGKRLSVVTDAAPEAAHEIRIGRTVRDEAATMPTTETYGITVGDGHVQICAEAPYVLLAACGTLTAGDDVPADGKELRIPDGTEILTAVDTTELQAMSFNVFCDLEQREGDRAARVCTVIEQFLPDTFGVQEATENWMQILNEHFGDIYESVGISRGGDEDPKDEYSAIFYKKGLFREIESGTKWLTDTPDVYSRIEESTHPRIVTYALLERCTDGQQILFVNTHLEHTAAVARVKQTTYLLDILSAYTDAPVVMTGDFNAESNEDAIRMIEDTTLIDSSKIAEQAYTRTTFTRFGELEGEGDSTIDYVFVSEDRIDVEDYRVFDEMVDGDYPSDHFPVVIRYRLKDTPA